MNDLDKQFYKIVGRKLRELRSIKDLKLEDIANHLNLTPKTIQRYEVGERKINADTLKSIVEYLKEDYDIFINEVQVEQAGEKISLSEYGKKSNKIPVLGEVAAGTPIEEIIDIKGYIEIPEWMLKRGNYFALKIKGKSMEPNIQDGDIIVVRQQKSVENDEIAVVVVNGEEATVKQVKRLENGLMLIPHNRDYTPKFYAAEEVENKPVEIIGKVVELRRAYEE